MTTFAVLAVAAGLAVGRADGPALAAPAKEHAWLRQLVGEWEFESEAVMAPGQPPVKGKGSETVRAVGGFWTVGEMKCEMMGRPMTGLMTVGYDAAKKKYVGSWVCSACDWMCRYEGSVDSAGRTLTLNCEGPSPADPAKTVRMKDVLELTDKDTRVLTSSLLGDDGKWVPFMTMTARRKK